MSYEAWRISFQDSEQAARAAYQQLEQLASKLQQIDQQHHLHAHQKWAEAKAVLDNPKAPTQPNSVEVSRFLTDVMTAAGLLSCGKRDKGLAESLGNACIKFRTGVDLSLKKPTATNPTTSLALRDTHQQIKALSDAAEAIIKEFNATDTLTANQVYQRLADRTRQLGRSTEQQETTPCTPS